MPHSMQTRDKLIAGLALASSVPLTLANWWGLSAGLGSPLLPGPEVAAVLAGAALMWSLRHSSSKRFVVPASFLSICLVGSVVSGTVGEARARRYCESLLAAPTPGASGGPQAELAGLNNATCKIHDLSFGLWEAHIVRAGERVGYVSFSSNVRGEFSNVDVEVKL